MPPKRRFEEASFPAWAEAIEDPCLRDVVLEAFVARRAAVLAGADRHRACRAALTSGDATMDQIRYGRYEGKSACRKAATAVRKYDTARECAKPTASRHGVMERDRSRRRPRAATTRAR